MDKGSTRCYPSETQPSTIVPKPKLKIYKTKWFAKTARKAGIADSALCEAIAQIEKGQGGRSRRRRLEETAAEESVARNRVDAGEVQMVVHLPLCKEDRENTGDDELAAFTPLARDIIAFSADDIKNAVKTKVWMEVTCD